MADPVSGIVNLVLGKLANALLNNAFEELKGVSYGQIEQVQDELRLIHALLKDAGSMRDRKEMVTEWLNQVREIAEKINSVIDKFLHVTKENSPESSNWFRKIMKAVKRNYKMYKFGMNRKLKDITEKLNWIYKRGTDLGIKDTLGALDDVDDPEPFDMVDDPEVVGLEDDIRNIIKQLLDTNISRRTVLSIVGPGGLGKTTLAQKVFRSAEVEMQFPCRAWLSISQTYNLNDLWREILYSVEPQMKNKNLPVTDGGLLRMLKNSLRRKRYLIILDDVWDIVLWEQLEKALPDPNNASRVIITSRSDEVAKAADCNTDPYRLNYRNDADSLALLFRKAFQQHIEPVDYRLDLLEVSKKLTKKCGGLPLALVVLGGILKRRDRTYYAWSKVEETLDWHDEDLEKCMTILARSYEDLPDRLKSCFLYFACFPEGHKISGRHITRMWLVEGFIPEDGAGTMEDRAEKYLEMLVQRYLIQVTEKSWNGNCKNCSMHDLLRELAIRKAKEKNFFTVFSNSKDENQLVDRDPCRVALHFHTPTKGVNSENTRSLLCFGLGLLNFSGFGQLRVLTIEGVDMTQFASTEWLKGLIQLRYLGFRYCSIPQEIFKNISFNNLETIDLKGSHIFEKSTYCSDVVIPTLRHIYGPLSYNIPFAFKWDLLTNLQTLKGVVQDEIPRLGCSTKNLRTLGIIYYWRRIDRDEEWETLKGVLSRTNKLVSLRIETSNQIMLPFGNGGTSDLPCHDTIQSLLLDGKWTDLRFSRVTLLPSVEMFPTNLTKLTLYYSWLEKDPMPILEKLQSLRILRLHLNSYMGTKMICSTRGFPILKKLELGNLSNLTHWEINEGAMPILSHLIIKECLGLHALPELQKVQSLQELIVNSPSDELRVRMQGGDLYKTEHIPSVHISDTW